MEIETKECINSTCSWKINSLESSKILVGTSIVCDGSPHFGIVVESEIQMIYFNMYKNVFLDLDDQEIEFTMVSENNFEKLELLQKDKIEVNEQSYEEVAGFESLNSKIQTRTTAFSCKDDSEDYDESFLMSRPLPWVVRVFFKTEDSMKGTLCSGKKFYRSAGPWTPQVEVSGNRERRNPLHFR